MRISVIVPVYGVEAFLDDCMQSIFAQTHQELEILLVDDGSPDKCPAMCDAYAAHDSRVRVIHKQNEGLGLARNTGLAAATGDYVCFVDSDDFLPPDALETLADAAALNGYIPMGPVRRAAPFRRAKFPGNGWTGLRAGIRFSFRRPIW